MAGRLPQSHFLVLVCSCWGRRRKRQRLWQKREDSEMSVGEGVSVCGERKSEGEAERQAERREQGRGLNSSLFSLRWTLKRNCEEVFALFHTHDLKFCSILSFG